jgi:hypothetical protein
VPPRWQASLSLGHPMTNENPLHHPGILQLEGTFEHIVSFDVPLATPGGNRLPSL